MPDETLELSLTLRLKPASLSNRKADSLIPVTTTQTERGLLTIMQHKPSGALFYKIGYNLYEQDTTPSGTPYTDSTGEAGGAYARFVKGKAGL